ncbi:MAG TPA: Hsp20/alpha crystallin family protein [Gammaproteobacteria bacterium]|nr:Hsp20/alpha crystallin family protein [Gammaproteobacteria bacterium]
MAKAGKEMAQSGQAHPVQRFRRAQLLRPLEEFERLINEYWPRSLLRAGAESPLLQEMAGIEARLPLIDIVDRENTLVLRAELPGVDKDAVDISVTDDTVTIKASSRYEAKEESGDYYRREIGSGSFARTIGLPTYIDADKAAASFKDGVLELTLPKVEQSKRRQIPIQ